MVLGGCTAVQAAVPSFAELRAAQARIGRVIVHPLHIFDTKDPPESNGLFWLAHALHVTTRRSVTERTLPGTGFKVSVGRSMPPTRPGWVLFRARSASRTGSTPWAN